MTPCSNKRGGKGLHDIPYSVHQSPILTPSVGPAANRPQRGIPTFLCNYNPSSSHVNIYINMNTPPLRTLFLMEYSAWSAACLRMSVSSLCSALLSAQERPRRDNKYSVGSLALSLRPYSNRLRQCRRHDPDPNPHPHPHPPFKTKKKTTTKAHIPTTLEIRECNPNASSMEGVFQT